jgi:hypothetical protein
MMRLMLFAAIGISSFVFTGFSRGVALPTAHSDLAFNRPTAARSMAGEREKKEREGEREKREERHKRPSPQYPM